MIEKSLEDLLKALTEKLYNLATYENLLLKEIELSKKRDEYVMKQLKIFWGRFHTECRSSVMYAISDFFEEYNLKSNFNIVVEDKKFSK